MKRTPWLGFVGAFALTVLAPSRAHARSKCVEVSDVVGEQKCSSYGDTWSIERKWPITFRFGLRYGEVSTGGLTFHEQFKTRDRPKGYKGYSYPGSALGVGSLSSWGADGGMGFFLWGQLYSGLEGGVTLGSTSSATFTQGPRTFSDDGGVDVFMVHAGLPVGYRIPLGRASIRGEVLFGGMMVDVSHRVLMQGEAAPRTINASATRGLIEPRIAGDIWFTPHVSFGVYAGVNLVDPGANAFGISLTWHHRAFDGDMQLW